MRNWSLADGDPICLTLSADARLSNPDYANDQTWELSLKGGEPPALSIETSFGLRVRRMRFFPRFIKKELSLTDPADFHQPPVIRLAYPNFYRLEYWPFPGVEIQADYWVSGSCTLAGGMLITNHNVLAEKFSLEWVGLLNPLEIGEALFTAHVEGRTVLQGKPGDLALFAAFKQNAHPGKGPLPALAFNLELPPGITTELDWAACACTSPEESASQVKLLLAHSWTAALARIILQNQADQLEISTGDEELDSALALTQNTAYRLFFPGNLNLPHPTFVLSRQADHGHSRRGDGSDYPFLWNGQTALDAWFLSGLILPGGIQFAEGLLRNFIASQLEDGSIDWKPNLAGKPTRKLAQPVLATLAWQIFQVNASQSFLQEVYPPLVRFLQAWFSPRNDRDEDGLPEWDQSLQTGLEDNPLYDRWNAGGEGNEISFLESPGLTSLLYREAGSLLKISRQLQAAQEQDWLEDAARRLRARLDATWDEKCAIFHYCDRQTHQVTSGGVLITFQGSGHFSLRRSSKTPFRVVLKILRQNDTTRAVTIRLTGQVAPGETVTEEFAPRAWVWSGLAGSAPSQNTFTSLGKIEALGLEAGDQVSLCRTDTSREDISLLFPLWAGLPTPDRAQAIVETAFNGRFLQPYGVPDYIPDDAHNLPAHLLRVTPLWNSLVGEGLLEYGFRAQAADLVQRMLEAVLISLRSKQSFHQFYNPETGLSMGERNHLHGLVPLRLFLQVAGIQQIGQSWVILRDFNAFPFPVNVKYQGMMISCLQDRTEVVFPGGQSAQVTSPGLHRVSREGP